MIVSASKVADLQRVGMLSSLGEFSISGGPNVAINGVVHRQEEPLTHSILGSVGAVLHKEDFQGSRVAEPSHLKVIQRVFYRANFSREVMDIVVTNVRNPQQLFIRVSGLISSIGVVEGIFIHARPLHSRKLTFSSTCARNEFVLCLQ